MMKKFACIAGGIAVAASMGVHASEVTGLTTFNSGETISSQEMNDNFDAVKNAVNDNNTRIDNLENTVNDSTNGLGALGTKITNLENTVNDSTNGLGALGTKVTNLENTVNDSTNGLGALGTKVTNLENAVNDGTSGLSALGTRVGDLETRVGALESGGCPSDMVPVGPICVDKYEASVWDAKTGGTQVTCDPAASPNPCDDTTTIFARSVANVTPASNITWLQAQQACANVGKRLLTNAEWQMAAAGTQVQDDQGTELCNRNTTAGIQDTGTNSGCISSFGVYDMVGNVDEWVADWVVVAANTSGKLTNNADSDTDIFAVRRGGRFEDGANANIFSYYASRHLDGSGGSIANTGFRCAK